MSKFLSVLLCAFVILTAVACTPTSDNQSQKNYDKQKTLYAGIISQYTELLNAKYNGESLRVPNTTGMNKREKDIATALYGIVDNSAATEVLGYGYKDYDSNGIPELVLMTRYNRPLAIFTIANKKPILLEANYGPGTDFVFATENRFFMLRDTVVGHIEEAILYTCHVDGDKMIYDEVYGQVYDKEKKETTETFRIVDGNRMSIDNDAFRALNREYQKACLPLYSNLSKLEAPRIHFPLAESVADQELPVADFSDYAAIRNTYKEIVSCIETFNSSYWKAGKYDNLFAFPNDVSYEYYNRLLYAAYHGNDYAGYDEIDLNGDGQDELVLMNEDYRIKAIFTQKNGVPVLLDAFVFSYETCWLDDKGLIHVDHEDAEELKYSLYEFTKSGDYNLIYSVIADSYGRYLKKDGKIEPITYEASMELYYDNYCRYSEPFEPNEQTRNVSSLIYTPITEPAGDLAEATDKTWRKYADLDKTTGNEYGAYSNNYVTFEISNDMQIDMNFKYALTSLYPDPDRDHYLLDETTESFLKITVHAENGAYVFSEHGLKGRLEFGHQYLWIIIEESADQRFPVGNHCYGEYSTKE